MAMARTRAQAAIVATNRGPSKYPPEKNASTVGPTSSTAAAVSRTPRRIARQRSGRDYVRAVTSEATPRSAARRTLTGVPPTTLAWAVLALMLLVAAAFIFHETRGTTFWSDEWTWVLDRRGGGLDTFLEPHNEHLSLIPVAIYKLLFATVGLEHYGPYRAMVIVAHLGVTVLLFVYARRRVGSIPALCATALLLFLGPGWHNILWPFQIGWLISLGAGVGALLALDRADRKGDVTACALIAVSLASSGLGVAIRGGCARGACVGSPALARSMDRRLPLAPYAVWWIVYQPAGLERRAIDLAPAFAADSAAGAFGALAGLAGAGVPTGVDPLPWGRPLAVVAVIVLLWLLSRYKRVPPRILGLLTVMLAFWLLTGLRRAYSRTPTRAVTSMWGASSSCSSWPSWLAAYRSHGGGRRFLLRPLR